MGLVSLKSFPLHLNKNILHLAQCKIKIYQSGIEINSPLNMLGRANRDPNLIIQVIHFKQLYLSLGGAPRQGKIILANKNVIVLAIFGH